MKDRFQGEMIKISYFVNNSTIQNISTFSANTINFRLQKPEQYW